MSGGWDSRGAPNAELGACHFRLPPQPCEMDRDDSPTS
jgi:hypothetical protein